MSLLNYKYFLLYTLPLYLRISAVKGLQADGNIERLLEPLQQLQIGINFDGQDKIFGALGSILDGIWRYISKNDIFFRICSKQRPEVKGYADVSRHSENLVAWLILRRAEDPKRRPISLEKAIEGCVLCSDRESALYRDLFHLVMVHGDNLEWSVGARLNLPRCSSPFHLIILGWYSPDLIPAGSVFAHDVCFGRICRMVDVPTYFELSKTGVSAVVKHVQRIRKDFLRDRILIRPSFNFHGESWYNWLHLLGHPLRYHRNANLGWYYYGSVLLKFAQLHNFTFNTIGSDLRNECKFGVIKIGVTQLCTQRDCRKFANLLRMCCGRVKRLTFRIALRLSHSFFTCMLSL